MYILYGVRVHVYSPAAQAEVRISPVPYRYVEMEYICYGDTLRETRLDISCTMLICRDVVSMLE